jgi:Cu/Ag efflux protein CusF
MTNPSSRFYRSALNLLPRQGLLALALASAALVAMAQALPTAEGEVRKVDKAAGKISLKHGEIKNLDMPPMSMVFQVKDRALLDKVKAGDKVSFTADQIDGNYTVISIEPRK